MKLEDCIKRIDKYMHSSDYHPRLVNVQNCNDMNAVTSHFNVGTTVFKSVEDYAKADENPSEAALFNDLRKRSGCVFLAGFTSYYRLLGEQKLRELLKKLVSFTGTNLHVVFLCYQCEKYLNFLDIRYKTWIYDVEGTPDAKTSLVFTAPEMPILSGCVSTAGIEKIASVIEKSAPIYLYVRTGKSRSAYLHSLIEISEQSNAYSLLCAVDPITNQLLESYGTSKQWQSALDIVKNTESWAAFVDKSFGSTKSLELALNNWPMFDEDKKWMYFLALKLFGAPHSWCLTTAIDSAEMIDDLVPGIYQSILKLQHNVTEFWSIYNERKHLIQTVGCSEFEVANYCEWVISKGKYALYYLSDMSTTEINMIFKLLDAYGLDFTKTEVMEILNHVYLDIYQYLQPYDYKHELLNRYFEEYKYQKVINKVFPEFAALVEEQAVKRDYNLLLPSRSEKTESIDMTSTLVYFVDAMGVEYLSYIMAKCKEKKLMAYTTLCHCEIPSITILNKEFIEVFENGGAFFAPDKNGIKSLDEIKHHGEEDFDYTHNTLPTHLATELRIINEVITKAFTRLYQNSFDRVVLISDHGASRLSVISNQENQHQMAINGMHSGRCCPKSETDIQPDCAIASDNYWVLANYDRFKGSRKANIEVHGGATLEEVVIPIIEITRPADKYEFFMLTPEITFSRRKKNASIRIFSKTKVDGLTVRLTGFDGVFSATCSDGQNFTVAIPDMKNTGAYKVEVYFRDNLIDTGLSFYAENSDFKEKKLL